MRNEQSPTKILARVWPLVVLYLLVIGIVGLSFAGPVTLQRTMTVMLINLVMVVALYMFAGNSGVLSFGHASFMVVAAYTSALLSMPVSRKTVLLPNLPSLISGIQLPPVVATLAGAILAAAFGFLLAIPIMRLSGISAGIATFSVLIIVQVVASNSSMITGSRESLTGIPMTSDLLGSLVWALITIGVAFAFQETGLGLRLRASREDEVAASTIGISIVHERLVAFVLSAFFAGISGALYGHFLGAISPNTFYLPITFLIIAMLVVGGINSLAGAVTGTLLVSVIAEMLRTVEAGISVGTMQVQAPSGLREVGLALLMLFVLILRPKGITGGKEISWPWGSRKGLRQDSNTMIRAQARTPDMQP